MATTPAANDVSPKSPEKAQTPAQQAFCDWIKNTYKVMSRTRYAEEREWAQAGYFDQLKQWLDEDPQTKRLRPMAKPKNSKWPMPVSNYFSKTIAANANALGADVPDMLALANNYDARNRRAAEAAENAIIAANRESGMEVLNPQLARRVPLWGLGITYDTIAFDHSTVEIPDFAPEQETPAAQQPPSGPTVPPVSTPTEVAPSTSQQPPAASGSPQPNDAQTQPQSGDPVERQPSTQVIGTQNVPTARLKTFILTPFEVYLPRDAQDANLSSLHLVRWRKTLGDAKELYPDFADELEEDDADGSIAFFYMNTLRSLAYQSEKQNDGDVPHVTLTEVWLDWTDLAKEVQDAITKEWQSQPSQIYVQSGMTKLQAAIEYGLFGVAWQEKILQWGENPWDGEVPLTYFPWQKDVLSVYPKGLSVELIPLTKSLNRVDSLMLRAVMSNGTVKCLWPTTQTTPPPTGDPIEIVQWDPLGDGKVKPEYFSGHAYGPELMQLRKQIVDDINDLGFNNSVAEGDMPGSGTAFRALAYLGAKAEETRKTQRYLWEQAHELRARKLLKMARKVWTEPRMVQVSGFNNRFGAQEIEVADLDGGFELNVIQDSSRPKTMVEKLEALQMLTQGGYVSSQDLSTKEYVLDTLGMTELDISDHLQFEKAERDLQKMIQGIQPMESPFENWAISLKLFADYTLTEDFEALPDNVRHGILMYTQYVSEKLQVASAPPPGPAMPGGPPPPPGALPAHPGAPHGAVAPHHPPGALPPSQVAKKGGIGGQPAPHVLGQVPGLQVSSQQVQGAAQQEASNLVPNAANPQA